MLAHSEAHMCVHLLSLSTPQELAVCMESWAFCPGSWSSGKRCGGHQLQCNTGPSPLVGIWDQRGAIEGFEQEG